MDFVAVLEAWAKDEANENNAFLPLVKWLAEIITFIAGL